MGKKRGRERRMFICLFAISFVVAVNKISHFFFFFFQKKKSKKDPLGLYSGTASTDCIAWVPIDTHSKWEVLPDMSVGWCKLALLKAQVFDFWWRTQFSYRLSRRSYHLSVGVEAALLSGSLVTGHAATKALARLALGVSPAALGVSPARTKTKKAFKYWTRITVVYCIVRFSGYWPLSLIRAPPAHTRR